MVRLTLTAFARPSFVELVSTLGSLLRIDLPPQPATHNSAPRRKGAARSSGADTLAESRLNRVPNLADVACVWISM